MRKGWFALALAAALLGAAALWRMQTVEEASVQTPTATPTPSSTASASEQQRSHAAAQVLGTASDPVVSEHEARMDFHNRVRTFFAQAPAMSADERTAQAGPLHDEIERYRAAGELSAAEAFTLRVGLIRESVPSAEQQPRLEALREEYRTRSVSASSPTADPMFELYKAREREIVAQVQALETVPDGLSRDEYLRQALQKEREALLGN